MLLALFRVTLNSKFKIQLKLISYMTISSLLITSDPISFHHFSSHFISITPFGVFNFILISSEPIWLHLIAVSLSLTYIIPTVLSSSHLALPLLILPYLIPTVPSSSLAISYLLSSAHFSLSHLSTYFISSAAVLCHFVSTHLSPSHLCYSAEMFKYFEIKISMRKIWLLAGS